MLFLLKRTWRGALAGFVLLTLLALGLRQLVPSPLPLEFTWDDLANGVLTFAAVLVSDGLIYGLFLLLAAEWYRPRHRELARLFAGQSLLAILLGSLMAGVGEELCFRSLDGGAAYLFAAGVVFGLLHHVQRLSVVFTVWSVWQGMLFALAMLHFQRIGVTMTAHFLHDLTGFLVFRLWMNRA